MLIIEKKLLKVNDYLSLLIKRFKKKKAFQHFHLKVAILQKRKEELNRKGS